MHPGELYASTVKSVGLCLVYVDDFWGRAASWPEARRTLAELIPIYHDIVGRGMIMEMAFSIDRSGLVQDTHAAMYQALGDWVRECYGMPVGATSGRGAVLTWAVHAAASQSVDRLMLREEMAMGERVRRWRVEARAVGAPAGVWTTIASGGQIGRKRIVLLKKSVPNGATLRLVVDEAIAPPAIAFAGAFAKCRDGFV